MDDECKEYRRSKPQQKLYKPGSGPLRRSGNGFDGKMDTYEIENGSRARSHYGSHNSVNDLDISVSGKDTTNTNRHKKPEQQLYVPKSSESGYDMDRQTKASMRGDNNSSQYMNRRMSNKHDNKHGFNSASGSASRGAPRRDRSYAEYHSKDITNNDINYNRHYRQVSEPRAQSPTLTAPELKSIDRNRDSRSMETTAGRQGSGSGAKPPSGRRNSAGYPTDSSRPKYMVNLDNIPPRFRKKFLEQSGHHSFDSMDHKSKQFSNYSVQSSYNHGPYANSSWSQTLPSRGRGRLRDNDNFDREKFINSYLKNYEVNNSRRSTPSNSYLNLCEPSASEDQNLNEKEPENLNSSYVYAPKNESFKPNQESTTVPDNQNENSKHDTDTQDDNEAISHSSSNLLDMTNLDWTEEVEKNIKLDDMCETSTSFSQNIPSTTVSQEIKANEPRESKRRSRRRDKRSSSRGQRNSEKKADRNRKDSNVSIQHEVISSSLKQRDRERRDSYKSNRSSTIGNSRDDLDHWRSLRSFSREQSTEGRIVSQCNSRDVSAHRALSPRDHDGFRVPVALSKNSAWSSANQKKVNGAWGPGRGGSVERRQSPGAGMGGPTGGEVAEGSGGGRSSRRSGKRSGKRRGRNSENIAPPVPQPPGATPAPTTINWRDEILESKKHTAPENTHQRNRLNSVMSDKTISETSTSQPGLLILPQSSHLPKEQSRGGSVETQKTLYDHHNPSKPIIVQTSPTQVNMRMERGLTESSGRGSGVGASAGQEAGEAGRAARHCDLLRQVDRADAVLHTHSLMGPVALAEHWPEVAETRKFLQNALTKLLMSDLKYCQADNIEHNFWKILYYTFIEKLRRSLTQVPPEDKPKVVNLINTIIEEGNVYFENLVQMLEKTYKFNTDDFINDNHVLPPKGLGYVGLALISIQKLYVFLGDLTRYKEQVNETNNYAKSKFWYTKAQQINPKNGRPYNQLAILAIYARRKLDAVYYYMRSLMSSNPFQSARESLLSLFDENRKKYEAAERKRRAAAESTAKTSESGDGSGHGLRRETWVRPSGHRTTTLRHDSMEERLAAMTSVELNKNFITSYLHVHGKLITKIGMETFHESAAQMLCQFRSLLHRQPLPTPAARLLQLTALNMFAVEATVSANTGSSVAGGRSAWLECALGVSLLMFGAMLERCCALLPEPAHSQHHADALLLLPAIKVWSDWMLCHSSVWNPPPSFDNFEIGTENDPWDWLAKLMNILEVLDDKSIELESEPKEGYVSVRLAEDSSLAGFTPLMYMEPAAAWARADPPAKHHAAEHALRTRKLLFFGTEYLVGVDPPVLRLEYPTNGPPRYVSAVQHAQTHHTPLQHLSEDSEDEDSTSAAASGPPSLAEGAEAGEGPDETTRRLLKRKEQLESRKANLERRRQRMQEILRVSAVSVEVEVRPRWLVPDTNCFIDHLPLLKAVAAAPAQPYQLAVPLVVLTELEGLRKCERVGGHADAALAWLNGAGGGGAAGGVRFATTMGSLLASHAFTERDQARTTNDDRVLATALNLHVNISSEPDARVEEMGATETRGRRVWEVVLLTDDRNLRVKALAAELPARDLPSFVQWAGLTPATNFPTDVANDMAISSK